MQVAWPQNYTGVGWDVYGVAVDVIFLIDICLNFLTTFRMYGREVWDPYLVVRNYLTTWFFIDFCASFPGARYPWGVGNRGVPERAPCDGRCVCWVVVPLGSGWAARERGARDDRLPASAQAR
eukprot:7376816-Prymnesium_polylepis.1